MVRAAGAASGMHPDRALLALGPLTPISLALDNARHALEGTSRAWPGKAKGAGAGAGAAPAPSRNPLAAAREAWGPSAQQHPAPRNMPVGLSPNAAPPSERAQLTARRYFLAQLRVAEAALSATLAEHDGFLRFAASAGRLEEKGAAQPAALRLAAGGKAPPALRVQARK